MKHINSKNLIRRRGGAVLSPEQLATWVHIAALELACDKNTAELAVLGSVFTQLGDTLTTMSTQQSLIEAQQSKQN